ncbi:molybdenum cofactor biosynthesis protein MoaE [Xanthovirga aplysinae]|uniref:molybdenum cofactor biosynthesis protein MoaE n=1 Tax=Xanthovirga aplysinae TaxID=2529853 RepID=UPI0031B5F753
MKTEKKPKKVFREGPISPEMIAESIAKHSSKTEIGAHSIFLGQVRNDQIEDKQVIAIEYSAYESMAEKAFHNIREDAFSRFDDLTCLHIYHSLGEVKIGEICLFVFVSSRHREQAFEASRFIVEQIKKEVPIFGKEVLEDKSFSWKVNQ